MNQKLTVGRIVQVYVDPRSNNGSDVCPAILTHVWGASELSDDVPVVSVNMRLFLDHPSNDPATNEWRTSAQVFVTQAAADLHLKTLADSQEHVAVAEFLRGRKAAGATAFMPPRV